MAIIIDLDGTLCNNAHRLHFAQQKEWEEYHSLLMVDEPYEDIVWFLENLPASKRRIILSGRPKKYEELTRRWLDKHRLSHLIDGMEFRADDDWTPEKDLKIQMVEKLFDAPKTSIRLCLDDRDDCVEAYRNYGIACWQVRNG